METLNNNTLVTSNRIEYVDIIKGIAIFFVVIGHVLAWAYVDWDSATKQNFVGTVVWNWIYSFHMPLFMFVSGYVVFNPHKEYSVLSVLKRTVQYIIPFLFVGVVLYYYRNDPSGIFNYWYLRALAEYVVVLFLLDAIFRCIPIRPSIKYLIEAITFVVLFYFIIVSIPENSVIDTVLCRGHMNLAHFFILGWYLRRNKWIEDKILSNILILPLSLAVIFIYLVFGVYKQSILTLAGILATYEVAKLLVGTKVSIALQNWGRNTMEIYILHFFFLFSATAIGEYFLSVTHLPTAITLQFAYGTVISILNIYLCIYSSKLFHKNGVLACLFFGKMQPIEKFLNHYGNSPS